MDGWKDRLIEVLKAWCLINTALHWTVASIQFLSLNLHILFLIITNLWFLILSLSNFLKWCWRELVEYEFHCQIFFFWAYDNIVISMFSYFSLGHWVCSLTIWNILRKWFFQQWNFVGTYCRSLGFSKSCLYYRTRNGPFWPLERFYHFRLSFDPL